MRLSGAANDRNKKFSKRIHRDILDSRFLVLLTTPVIWACLVPVAFLDLILASYQTLCFPVYGIPKVRRADYILLDRDRLACLNLLEKLNCQYCGYANGVLAYATKVAGRNNIGAPSSTPFE